MTSRTRDRRSAEERSSWMRKALARLSGRIDPAAVPPRTAPLTPERVQGPLRIGYVVWDWPALSQTFVLHEIQELQSRGHDVVVYFKVPADTPATLTFTVAARPVADADELARLVRADERQVLHSPFAYPSTTLLVWPAAQATGVPFSFMAGGVDVAHYANMERNRVGEVASSDLCLGVITLGTFHRDLLIDCGVPSSRIVMERQSASLPPFAVSSSGSARPRVVSIGRFIEKKGLDVLVRAAPRLADVDIVLHGYGPLEDDLRALASEVGAGNVTFAGPLEGREALERVYHGADAFALPCVRAENGDLDGLPTVLLESMAAGVPVVTTDAANIPDLVIDGKTGFLCRQRDVDSLVAAVRRCLDLTAGERTDLVRAARRQAEAYASPQRTTDTLLRLWRRDSIDIVLVTFDRDGYKSEADTFAIVDRLLRLTSLPFSLTIVDNHSDRSFVTALRSRYGKHANVEILPLSDNLFCGPASNLGFSRGRAPYLVYVCSNEGFVLRHGWEHQLVRSLERTGGAMGGYLVELRDHGTGTDIQGYPSFSEWRAQDFAANEPDRRFAHVQGGLFVLRRDVFESSGGFNPAVPQNGMDVEYSYYLESLGHELVQVPGVVGISVKTRPALHTLVDEFTVAVHPSRADAVGLLDSLVAREVRLCSVCSWSGPAFAQDDGVDRCPSCGSHPFSRSVMRLLSQSGRLQTRPRTHVIAHDASLRSGLSGLIPDLVIDVVDDPAEALASAAQEPPRILVVDRFWSSTDEFADSVPAIAAAAGSAALAVVGVPTAEAAATSPVAMLRAAGLEDAVELHLVSGVCSFDLGGIAVAGWPWPPAALQGIEC